MKIKVGDRVKFLNDTGAGEVTRIVDPKTALVLVDDGFEVPWMIKDLVVDAGRYDDEEDEPVTNTEVENDGAPTTSFSEKIEEDPARERIGDEEVLLAFVPDENSAEFDAYLVNSSSYNIKYTISRQQEGELVLFHEGTLEPGIKIRLGTYKPGNLNDEENFRVQGIYFNAGFFNHMPPLDILIRVSASEMFDAAYRRESDYFLEKAVLHTLHDWRKPAEPPKIEISAEALKQAMYTKGDVKPERPLGKKEKSSSHSGIEEVDLHIQHLVDDYSKMDNAEILEVQLSRFRTALESAILHKTSRIVFIHGVGNGKLKHELRRILEREYKNVRYQDASFREYGYGATMVLVK